MKKLTFFFTFVVLLGQLFAQNPLSEHGIKESDYLTLSDGRYDEFHEYNDFERVGSAIIDMRTNKISRFIDRDSVVDEGMAELDMTTRFLTIDPMAEKYSQMSPYGYCANNPLNAIDPDGREIIYLVRNDKGGVASMYKYEKGNFHNTATNQIYDIEKGGNSNLTKLAGAYNTIENSDDDVLKGQLHQLEGSNNVHYIEEGWSNGVIYLGEGDTQTMLNFEKEATGDYKDIGRSDVGNVAHEMRHQYDYDINNMKDNKVGVGEKRKADNPAEIRAVANENREEHLKIKNIEQDMGLKLIEKNLEIRQIISKMKRVFFILMLFIHVLYACRPKESEIESIVDKLLSYSFEIPPSPQLSFIPIYIKQSDSVVYSATTFDLKRLYDCMNYSQANTFSEFLLKSFNQNMIFRDTCNLIDSFKIDPKIYNEYIHNNFKFIVERYTITDNNGYYILSSRIDFEAESTISYIFFMNNFFTIYDNVDGETNYIKFREFLNTTTNGTNF